MNEHVQIRDALREDAATIVGFLEALAAHDGHESDCRMTVDDVSRYGFDETRHFDVLIAEVDGTAAGMALYYPAFSTWDAKPTLFLNDLFVDDRFRGFGLGRRLLSALARIALERGYSRLDWQVLRIARAVDFYRAIGAREVDEFCNFRLENEALSELADGN
jgi:GNAT superfamily N-acetyltransferase